MGSFSVACSISKITISEGDKCIIVPLIPNPRRICADTGCHRINPKSMLSSPMEYFMPLCLPIKGKYNDYGSIKNIEKNENTKVIEKFFGISIEDFVDTITIESVDVQHASNLKILESLSCMFVHGDVYDYYLSLKKNDDRPAIQGWMLIELGFNLRKNSINKFIKNVNGREITARSANRGIYINDDYISDIKCFKEYYEKLTLSELDVSKYENIDMSFAEIKESMYMRNNIKNMPDLDDDGYKEYLLANTENDYPIATGLYRDWPLFEEIYKDVFSGDELDALINEYPYFYWGMHFSNTMLFPSFCGNQSHNADNELELAEIIKIIAGKRKQKSEYLEKKYTGFKDKNGRKIFVGNTVIEGCNNLIGTVGWDEEKGTYKLLEYGNYYIEDSNVE